MHASGETVSEQRRVLQWKWHPGRTTTYFPWKHQAGVSGDFQGRGLGIINTFSVTKISFLEQN